MKSFVNRLLVGVVSTTITVLVIQFGFRKLLSISVDDFVFGVIVGSVGCISVEIYDKFYGKK